MLGKCLQLVRCGAIQAQHETCVIRAGVMRAPNRAASRIDRGDMLRAPLLARGEILAGDYTQQMPQPRGHIEPRRLGSVPYLLVELGVDHYEQVMYWTLCVVMIDLGCLLTTEPPAHHLAQHRGPRLMKLRHQVLQCGARGGIQASIHADTDAWLVGPMLPWVHRRSPLVVDPQY
jgi:hypothetical protein